MTETRENETPGALFAAVFLAILGAMLVFITLTTTFTGMHEGGWEVCHSRGVPDDVNQETEDPSTRSSLSYLPFGVVCGWQTADGRETIDYRPNVIPTLTLYGGFALSIVGFVLAIRIGNRTQND